MRAFLMYCQVAGLAATLANVLHGQGGAVGYVGAAACSKCHPEQTEAFRSTPMGRSITATSSLPADFLAKPVEYAHAATSRHYRLFRLDETAFIEESFRDESGDVLYADLRPLDYVIGSGNHAQSFLTANRGRLYQSPITYYAGPGRWEMSPGYDSDVHVGFTRRVSSNCLACHVGRLNVEDQASSRLRADAPFAEMAIGCERCHGPGSAHAEDPPGAVVNPTKLAGKLRDQVCEQCHLFGDARVELSGRSMLSYQPGLPLDDFLAVYALAESGTPQPSVTGHPLEMRASRCWQNSQGELWCGSCHEVHAARGGEKGAAFYRSRCLECHDQQPCSRPRQSSSQPDTSDCVGCHMPKRSVVESNHVVFTDHRVPRQSTAPSTAKAGTVLRSIYPPPGDEPVAQRNLGFAYAELASSTGRQEFYQLVVNTLQPLAETSIADADFRENLGTAYLNLGDLARAEQEFRLAVKQNPGSATAFYSLGFLCQLQGRPTEAIEVYERALMIDPQKPEVWGNLAAAYQIVGEASQAKEHLRRALELDPGHLRWRRAWLSLQP